ncbi:trehalose-phosphatase [Ascobolus immersus RN42]|uniref:Trehalose 6-phosphate phosphatase n=1 Tax=Ascobolus immersus RN42 TaxID=1160509 RepID=A0A3N4HGT5_ASCIM|nr:trehalose-phosphatase [Ascobolus immersus RN42]
MGSVFNLSPHSPRAQKLVTGTLKARYENPTERARLFLFDYDGTLTPIINDPNKAIPTKLALDTITKLAEPENNAVWIISGRDAEFLKKHWGHIAGVGLSAEHGCFVRQPHASEWTTLVSQEELDKWQPTVRSLFRRYSSPPSDSEIPDLKDYNPADYHSLCPGSRSEEKRSALTWHYRNAEGYEEDKPFPKEQELMAELKEKVKGLDVTIMPGKANIEVRPSGVSKGDIVRLICQKHGRETGVEFVVCCGDDTTDEDMFHALSHLSTPTSPVGDTGVVPPTVHVSGKDVFSIHVGPAGSKTDARFYIESPAELVETISALV